MATIEKAGKRWRVREFSGGKLRTVASLATKPEALAMQRSLNARKSAVAAVRGVQIPMPELVGRWAAARIEDGNDPHHTPRAAARVASLCERHGWGTTAHITAASVVASKAAPRSLAMLRAVVVWAAETLDQYADPKALLALRPRRPGRRPAEALLTDRAVVELQARADAMCPSAGALVHCLAVYGWRPITAARLTVGDLDQVAGTITTAVKGGDIVRHPLLASTMGRLLFLAGGQPLSAPLFRDPRTGKGWPIDGAGAIPQWARDHLRIKVYDLKRYAITGMLDRGLPAHTVALFTGHRTISQVLRYARSNEERARAALSVLESPWKAPRPMAGDATAAT